VSAVAEQTGWAEPHFLVHTGQAPATVLMVYAPRDDLERDVVLGLVRASYEFALAPSGQTVARTYGRPYHQAPN
jgi:hypothetical protein